MSKPKRPREGQESAWATYFAAVLRAQGHDQAAASMLASLPKESEKRLPRGVYEKVPGSGDYWVRYADPSGKIRRQHVGRSLAAARDIAERRRSEVRQGKFDPESVGRQRRQKMTVAEMFEHYRPLRVDVRNKGEDARYGAYWSERFGSYELEELTKADLMEWRSQRMTEVKPATVNRALTYLRAYYNLAIEDGHCTENPAAKVKALRENNARDRFLDDDEEARLRQAMSDRDFLLVAFAIQTGLRQSEQFRLRWENVDLKTGNLKIVETKAGGHRFVPINSPTRELLASLRTQASKSPWVFPSRRDPEKRINQDNFISRNFRKALKEANIKRFTWHDLRRTTGSRLAMAGVPLHTIAQILGQATPRVTAIYSRLSPTHLRGAMEHLAGASDTTTDTCQKSEP